MGYLKVLLILLVFGLFVFFLYVSRHNQALKVAVVPAEIDNIVQSVSAPGEIKSENEAALRFTTSGKILFLPYTVGETVKKGAVLARLDGTQTLKNLENARLEKQKAIDFANEIRETYEGNLNEGPGLYKLKQAEKAIQQAENSIKIYENALFHLTLYAPFTGTIIEKNKIEGEIWEITNPDPIITLADLENLYFEALVDEEDIGQIAVSQTASIELDSYPNREFQGEIYEIAKSAIADLAGNKAVKVKIRIKEDHDTIFRLDLSGETEIIQQQKRQVLTVPKEAISQETERTFVYTIIENRATKREISPGLENDDFVEILEGLKKGDRVIISDLDAVAEGRKVTISEE